MKICTICNLEFNPNNNIQIYCSKKCRNKKNNKTYNGESKKCKNCNNDFNPNKKEQKYCSVKCSSYFLNKDPNLCRERGQKSSVIKLPENGIFLKNTIRQCIICKENFTPKTRNQKLCNKECATIFHKTDETKKINAKKYGSIGGQISAEKQQRRSKNEIVCADLCIEYFGENDILCNERIFKDKNENMWDADIVIKSLKIAILYDGNWHRKKCNKKHNLEHVQLRDKWKREIILNNGYTYYTINDFGGFNKKFVQDQFNLFIHKLDFKNTIEDLNTNILF